MDLKPQQVRLSSAIATPTSYHTASLSFEQAYKQKLKEKLSEQSRMSNTSSVASFPLAAQLAMAESRKGTASKDSRDGDDRAETRQETATQLDSIFERISNLRKILKNGGNATKSSGECSSNFHEKAENSYSRSS